MKQDIETLIEKYTKTINFLQIEIEKAEDDSLAADKLNQEKYNCVIFKIELELVLSRNES